MTVFADFRWSYGHWMLFLIGVGIFVPVWMSAKRRAKSKVTQEPYLQLDDLEVQVAVKKKAGVLNLTQN
ncbi:MAG: hypothetical protein ABL923_11870 [Burkholderiaceae bacterium]